jgi:hypothetical protein
VMGVHYEEVLMHLEPYGLPDGAWLAPCVAVATILIAKRGHHLRK